MPSIPPNPHDALFRAVFHVPRYAAGLLRIVLPADLLSLLDVDRLEVLDASHVAAELRGAASDLVLKVARRTPAISGPEVGAFVTLAIEHQSRDERFIALRQLQYERQLWAAWLHDHPGATHLPPIVAVVVHTGATPWRSPTSSQALIDLPAPPLDAALRPFLPDFRLVLEDLATDPVERLRAAGVEPVSETTLEVLQNAASPAAEALFQRWLDRLDSLRAEPGGASTLASILCYLLYVGAVPSQRVVEAAEELPEQVKDEVVAAAQELMEKGRLKGLEEGRQEGRQEGQHLALAAVLIRLSTYRFGPIPAETSARIQAATTPEIERWLEGLLTVERLNDLFQ